MTPLITFLATAALAVVVMTATWLWQRRTRNAGLVDAVWALTLGVIVLVYAIAGDAPLLLRVLMGAMGGLWGLRLGLHLWRRQRGAPEDWRYAQLRTRWGVRADRNLFWFFQFQNVFTLLLSASAWLALSQREQLPSPMLIALAIVIWLVSVLGEAWADAQMAEFRLNPANKGRVCSAGLWAWSRHPNYFFECLHWAAYVPLAIGAPWGWTALFAPLVMAFLLLCLSGVPLMEAEMIRRKPAYADYVKRTSMLIPLPPKIR